MSMSDLYEAIRDVIESSPLKDREVLTVLRQLVNELDLR